MNNIEILENAIKCNKKQFEEIGTHILLQDDEMKAIENLIKENKELKEYKKIAELTKISCCTAQNCEALNNAIKNGLENEKLLQENKELKDNNKKLYELCQGKAMQEFINNECDYIPKSKVKEKIKKLDKKKRKSQIEYSTIDELIFDKKIEILQELLEEGE